MEGNTSCVGLDQCTESGVYQYHLICNSHGCRRNAWMPSELHITRNCDEVGMGLRKNTLRTDLAKECLC